MGNSFVENRENLPDETLVERINSGDYELLRILFSRYTPIVRSMSLRTARNDVDVEDLMQEGLISLYSAVKGYSAEKSSFRSFAMICIKRAMVDFIRSNTRKKLVPPDMCSSIDETPDLVNTKSAESEFIEKESLKTLTESIRVELSEFEYKVLASFLSDNSYTDIAKENNVSVKSVDNALKRIRTKLKCKNDI